MGLDIRGVTSAVINATTSRTINKPSGVVEGDLMLFYIGTNTPDRPAPRGPEGWEEIAHSGIYQSSRTVRIFQRYATADEPSSYSYLFETGLSAAGIIAFYSDQEGQFARLEAVGRAVTTLGAAVDFPSVNVAASAGLLACFATFGSNTAAAPPTGFTERWDVGSATTPATRAYAMTGAYSASGATGIKTATAAGDTIARCVTVALSEGAKRISAHPQRRHHETYIASTDNPRTFTVPTVAEGDLLLFQLATSADVTPTLPTGWELVPSTQQTGTNRHAVFARRAGASEPGTVEVSFSGDTTSVGAMISLYLPGGVPVGVVASASQTNSASATRTWPGVTVAEANALLLCFGQDTARTVPVESELSEIWDGPDGALGRFLMKEFLAATGSTGTRTATGASSASKTATVAVAEVVLPDAPSDLTATTVDHTQIDLAWVDNSSDETLFSIERSPDGSAWSEIDTVATDVEAYQDTGLAPGTTYYYRVRALGTGGYSDYSNTDSATTDLSPLVAPTDLAAAPVLSDKIRLAWNDTNDDEDEFDIGRSLNGVTGWSTIDTTTDTTYDDDELSPETTYYYRVRAVRGVETTAWSNVANATTYAELTEPTEFAAVVVGPRQVNLSWENSDNPRTGFIIENSTDGDTWTEIGTTPVTSFQATGLDPETVYLFRARAYREGSIEFGPLSEEIEVETPSLPEPPRLWRLFLLSPAVVFAASVNEPGGVTYPLDEVRFDTVTAGSYTAIQPGMLAVFRLPGSPHPVTGHDLGRQRIRKAATSNTLYIGRSSQGKRDGEVDIEDNTSITVLDLYGVHSKIPRFDPDGTTYKDSDLAYDGQTLEPPPVANTGPAMAGTIDGGVLVVDFDAGASFATADGASITSYLWDVMDGTITVGADTDQQITVEFPAGFRWVALTVEDSNGKSHTARCPVFARDPDDDECIQVFEIETHRITPQGQQVGVRVRQPIDIGDYPDGTLALLWYGEPATPDDRSHMQFTGWIQQEPVNQAAQRTGLLQEVTLNFVDVAGRLELLPGFPQIIEIAEVPESWAQMANPNMDRYLHYLLHWHSTALDVADWTWTGTGDDYPFRLLGSDGQSLFSQVDRRAMALVPDYQLVCNRRGQLRTVVDPMLQEEADRTEVEQTTISLDDWSAVRYDRTRPPRVHWLRSNAILARPDVVAPIFCQAPGETPGQGEQELDHGEQLARNQTDLNAVTGHRYARINAPQSKFTVTLADGDDRGIEPADLTWVRLLVGAAQRVPGQVFSRRGLVQEINIRYDHGRTGLVRTVELQWERETVGTPAVTVIPAGAEPVPDGDFWGPPAPPLSEFIFELGLFDGINTVALITDSGYCYRTSNFQDASPTWDRIWIESQNNIDGAQGFVVDPFAPLYRGLGSTVRGWHINPYIIWFEDSFFGADDSNTADILEPIEWFHTAGSWKVLDASFGRFFETESDNPWLIAAIQQNWTSATSNLGSMVWYSVDGGQNWSSPVTVTGHYDNSIAGTGAPAVKIGGLPATGIYLSPKTPGLAYLCVYTSTGGTPTGATYKTEDWGATWSALTSPAIDPGHGLGGTIHVPWPDNDGESLVYHGWMSRSGNWQYRLKRVSGASVTDISPNDGVRSYGPQYGKFGVRTYDGNRQFLAVAGTGNDGSSDPADNKHAVFVSDDGGDTWTEIVAATDQGDPHPQQVAFAGDNPDVLFIWGSQGYIRYSDDFGATVQDKTGNLGGFGTIGQVVGICGGDALP